MNVASRGVRNAFRNGTRTISIVLILGISVGLALAMLVARGAVQDKINSVKSSIGNTITVSAAGARGFEGGGNPLTGTQIASLKSIAHVTNIVSQVNDRLTTSNTNLQSAIDAGSLGQRFSNNSGVGFQAPPDFNRGTGSSGTTGTFTRTFTPPVTVTGIDNLANTSVYGGSSVTYTSGKAFDPTSSQNVAVLGKDLAAKNNLSVGSTFTAYGTTITVVGIYDAGNTFANAGMLMPLATLQTLSGQTGAVNSATVTVDSLDNVTTVTKAIQAKLGSAADVVNEQETAQTAVAPLENVKTISLYSLIGALVAGAVIILLTMMMIVRERRREIGVMKAIGSSNAKTVAQFMIEAVTLTVLGLVVGVAFAFVTASPITNALVTNSASSSQTANTTGAPRAGRSFRAFRENTATNIKNIQANVGTGVIGVGVLAALGIAVIGSAVPAYFISKVRPSEVMRAE